LFRHMQEDSMRKNMNRFGAALAAAAIVAGGLAVNPVRLEAKGKKNPADPLVLFCQSLKSIIDYKYSTDAVRAYAQRMFDDYNCASVLD